ncbi:hypothetical protein ID866_6847 [Astraeus odoratus]|nr:hypothetical protein ID866_6847 [Astraeus odoratus]
MVSAQTVAEICNPTGVIQHLYDNYDGSDDRFASVVASHFAAMFLEQDEHGTIHQLPSLDVHHPPESYRHGTLVRFRAMVQDMSSSPELYLAKLGNHRCGGWGIFTSQGDETSDDVDYSNLLESTTLWAVSVPGESPWHAEEVSPSVPSKPLLHPSIIH